MIGHTMGHAIGLGYAANGGDHVTTDFVKSGAYEIEVACERFAAKTSLRPFYDPNSERVKM